MSNLYKVVDFAALADDCFTEPCTVYRCISADLHIILNNNDADLIDLLVPAIDQLIAVTIRSNHTSRLENNAVTYDTLFTYSDISVNEAILTHLHISTHYSPCTHLCAFTNNSPCFNNGTCFDRYLTGVKRNIIGHDGTGIYSW